MKIDLHCHSTASDGKLSPEELFHLAEQAELDYFAITDHDTTSGYRQLYKQDAVSSSTVALISGIEVSTQWSGVGIHIVGLDFDAHHPAIEQLILTQRAIRESRANIIDARLAANNMQNTLAGALTYCPDIGQVGRPHFAQHMVDMGYVKNIKQAFDRWLGNGKLGDVKSQWPEISEAVDAIISAGGIAVIAHPLRYKMTFTKLRRLSEHFKEVGGQAIEVIGYQASPDKQAQLNKMVADLSLFASAGSDFHDPEWRWSQIGKIAQLPASLPPVWQLFNKSRI